jgi:hypothetical protein
MTNFSINQLFEKAFGFKRGKDYDGEQASVGKVTERTYNAFGLGDTEGGQNPNLINVRQQLQARSYLGESLFMPVALGGVLLPNEPTISLSSSKTIVETPLVSSTRHGTVKELISIDDWRITLRGIAITDTDTEIYPEDWIDKLHKLYLRNESVEIVCGLTQLLNIQRVVIKNFELPEMIGIQHAQAYQLELVSDYEFILEL